MVTAIHTVRGFAHTHDEIPAFHASYLVLTFILSMMFNLGAFAVLIVLHMALDVWKYREYQKLSWWQTIEGTIRESLIDVTLLALGFLFSVYLHKHIGLGSVSTLLRTEFALVRTVALLVPKIKILHTFLKIISHIHHYLEQTHPHLHKGWSNLDKFCFFVIGVSCLLLSLAAEIMHVPQSMVNDILLQEVLPWWV